MHDSELDDEEELDELLLDIVAALSSKVSVTHLGPPPAEEKLESVSCTACMFLNLMCGIIFRADAFTMLHSVLKSRSS